MVKRSCAANIWPLFAAMGFLGWWSSVVVAQGPREPGGAGPPDPPPGYNQPAREITGPSVVKGQKAGIEVGQYAPDLKLEPIQSYAILEKWLGDKAPKSAEETVPLSLLVGKAPIMLLFGSYT